jgi:phosphate transport system substrate-binding protein
MTGTLAAAHRLAGDRRARRSVLVAALALVLATTGGSPALGEGPAAADGTTGSSDNTAVLLRVGGDDTTTATLVPVIASAFLGDRGATNIAVRRARPPWSTELSGDRLSGRRIAVLIRGNSSREGIRLLARGEVDIAATAREMTPEEVKAVAPLGDMTDPTVTLALASTAIVIAVHPDNPVNALTFEQLRDIYAGRIVDWAAVGGTPGPIHPFGRAPGAAARETVERNIMGEAPFGPHVRNAHSFTALHDDVLGDPLAIGYVPTGRLDRLKALRLTVGGFYARPDDYGVATGDYPLVLTMRLYRSPARTPEIDKFFREATSSATEVAAMFAGFSRVKPQLLVPSWPDSVPDRYREALRNGLRVSLTIRFAPDSTDLDTGAVRALDALARYLRHLNVGPQQLRHIAFSNNTGDVRENERIAERLGAIVVDELRRRHAHPGEVFALGAALPLASDQVPAGRQRNRRVETWIMP